MVGTWSTGRPCRQLNTIVHSLYLIYVVELAANAGRRVSWWMRCWRRMIRCAAALRSAWNFRRWTPFTPSRTALRWCNVDAASERGDGVWWW